MKAPGASLRVAQLVEALESGGAEALAIDIAGALAARGHDSHLIVLRGGGPFRTRVPGSVSFHDLDRPRRDGNQAFRIIYFLETARRLQALLDAERIDVLQTHLPKANFLGALPALRGRCRVCPTVHNNREFDYGDAASAVKVRMRRDGYRLLARRSHAMIAVSERVRASLVAELGLTDGVGGRIAVVPNGVVIPAPATPESRAEARARWGLSGAEVAIVTVGRLTRQKNHAALLKGLQALAGTGVAWRCIIAGEGELEADLRECARTLGYGDRVCFAGLVRDVPSLLAAADVFCLPSLYEGLPLSLLEAMAAGVPVAAFSIDGVAEVVQDGVHGRLAPPDDVHGLGRALGDLVQHEALRRDCGRAGRELVVARYGFDAVAPRLERIYGIAGPAPSGRDA